MSKKNKWIYIILAVLLGGFGVHKLYEGMPFKFILYICFAWTFIPAIVAFFEALHAALIWE